VTEQPSGLRFDIYERVNLSDALVGIRGLEEVELVPHIQVISQDDQAILQGNLHLSGVYEGEGDAGLQRLEHSIPVEITLPLNRIHRMEDISVEIENFDVDILSPRSMNITGVLSLHGIELLSYSLPWEEDGEEEVMFLHKVEDRDEHSAPDREEHPEAERADIQERSTKEQPEQGKNRAEFREGFRENDNDSSAKEHREDFPEEFQSNADRELRDDRNGEHLNLEPPEDRKGESSHNRKEKQEKHGIQETSFEDWDGTTDKEVVPNEAVPFKGAVPFDGTQVIDGEKDIEKVTDEMEEMEGLLPADQDVQNGMKIAIGTKEDETEGKNLLKSMIDKWGMETGRRKAESEGPHPEDPESVNQAVGAESHGSEETVEWKKLFLGDKSGEKQFRKVRMCIVQKEETLDMIAERYQLNPREIILYNRLNNQQLTEGQIIYIPK